MEAEIHHNPAETTPPSPSEEVQKVTEKKGRVRWPHAIRKEIGEEFSYFIAQEKVLRTDILQIFNENHSLRDKCYKFCTENGESDTIKKVYDY